jgi:glutathionylspermidine synthase
MNYAPKPYYRVSMNRKRQIIDATLDELHNMQLAMIDAAVDCSDLKEAQEIIDWIRKL